MKSKYFFLKLSIPFALLYWFADSAVHYFIYGEFEFEFIPSDFDELWMRCVIFILLVSFGAFADYYTNKILQKDKEKNEVYATMLHATQHILNNFLQSMLLFRHVAEKSKDIDPEILKLYDQTIDDAAAQVENLKDIQDPSKDSIEERFIPK